MHIVHIVIAVKNKMDATCAIQDNIHLLRLALELPQPTNGRY